MCDDLSACINEFLSSGKYEFFYGKETLQIQAELINKYYLKEEFELENEAVKKLFVNIKPDIVQSEQSRTLVAEGLKLQNKKNMTTLKATYEKMFGEAY